MAVKDVLRAGVHGRRCRIRQSAEIPLSGFQQQWIPMVHSILPVSWPGRNSNSHSGGRSWCYLPRRPSHFLQCNTWKYWSSQTATDSLIGPQQARSRCGPRQLMGFSARRALLRAYARLRSPVLSKFILEPFAMGRSPKRLLGERCPKTSCAFAADMPRSSRARRIHVLSGVLAHWRECGLDGIFLVHCLAVYMQRSKGDGICRVL